MADAFSPPAPSPVAGGAADNVADAPSPSSLWPAPRVDDGGGLAANPLFTILPVSAFGIGVVLLVAVAVILVVTRRGKPTRTAVVGESCSGDGKPDSLPSSCGSHNTRCYVPAGKRTHPRRQCGRALRYAHRAHCVSKNRIGDELGLLLSFIAGCIYGAGRLAGLGFAAQQQAARSRGAQVFTYRELERATDGFSEANVVGRGVYGVVFRGRLADGTPAAIKRLRLDHRRQGEREFRIEVRNQPLHVHVNSCVLPDRPLFRAPTGFCCLLALLARFCGQSSVQPAVVAARETDRSIVGIGGGGCDRCACVGRTYSEGN
jgi:hypothetical protein